MKKLLTAILFSFISVTAFAHPHSFLDMKNKVMIQDGKLTAFQMSWMLDEITSAELLYEVKASKNKQAAKDKITRELDESAVANHYFSELYNAKDEPIKFTAKPINSSIEVKENKVVYHFELTLADPQEVRNQTFRLFTFEPSYYLSMAYENAGDVTISEQGLCQVMMEEPKVNQDLRLYASGLDKTQTPDMPGTGSLSLGGQFAQKVSVICN